MLLTQPQDLPALLFLGGVFSSKFVTPAVLIGLSGRLSACQLQCPMLLIGVKGITPIRTHARRLNFAYTFLVVLVALRAAKSWKLNIEHGRQQQQPLLSSPSRFRFAHFGFAPRSRLRLTIESSLPTTSVSLFSELTPEHIATLGKQDWVVIPEFISPSLVKELRADVDALRNVDQRFKAAGVGQDSTNTLNKDIRKAETCFVYPKQPIAKVGRPEYREKLYNLLDAVGEILSEHPVLKTGPSTRSPNLDPRLHEALYVHYPRGGFYRRHQDAVPGSASVIRAYSFLLYLNEPGAWKPERDAGQLRLHFDSGGDFLPEGENPNFLDIEPHGGTMVLFRSDKIPHEVLDTSAERTAVVGWYNRGVSLTDLSSLGSAGSDSGGASALRIAMLAVAAGLVTNGLLEIASQL